MAFFYLSFPYVTMPWNASFNPRARKAIAVARDLGIQWKLELRQTGPNSMGLGVYALEDIPAFTVIMECECWAGSWVMGLGGACR